MLVKTFTSSALAQMLIWCLVAAGILVEILAIPNLSVELQRQYIEYKGDAGLIQSMLTGMIIFGQLGLVLVIMLLRRINAKQLLEKSSVKWINSLISSSLGLAVTFIVLLIWLSTKNTMPPGLGFFLVVAVFGSLTLALITQSLKLVLLGAIETRDELEGVI